MNSHQKHDIFCAVFRSTHYRFKTEKPTNLLIPTIFKCFELLNKMLGLSSKQSERAICMLQAWFSAHWVANVFNFSHTQTKRKVSSYDNYTWPTKISETTCHYWTRRQTMLLHLRDRFLTTTGSARQFRTSTGRVISATTIQQWLHVAYVWTSIKAPLHWSTFDTFPKTC